MGICSSFLKCLRRTPQADRLYSHTSSPVGETADIHDLPEELTSVPRYTGRKSRLFALIIGISEYQDVKNCQPLRGAVADAKAMKKYLKETLGVPENCIQILLDDQATRDAIKRAFWNIRDDKRIQEKDPILIFFAGHGKELDAPKRWCIEDKIQGIIPHDFIEGKVHPIPDHTIGALIDAIAQKKGDNITVIFDCCYAAGGTRSLGDNALRPRGAEGINPSVLLAVDNLDEDVLGGRNSVSGSLSIWDIRHHVLLAACGIKEFAHEDEEHGLFTRELLKILRDSTINNLTYNKAIERIRSSLGRQTPCYLGVDEQRVFFNAKVRDDGLVGYEVQVKDDGNLVVLAGRAHGVSYGVEFTLYEGQEKRLMTVRVDSSATVQDFQTILRMHKGLRPNTPFAKLTRVGKVSICFRTYTSLNFVRHLRRMGLEQDAGFRLVEESSEAKLEAMEENGRVCFRPDQRTRKLGLKKLPYVVSLETLPRVFSVAAHYYWYLHLKSGSEDRNNKVDINFYRLNRVRDRDGMPDYEVQDDRGLCRKNPGDNSDVIELVVDSEGSEFYGIKIWNHTQRDLYVNAFLFNGSSLKIEPYRIQSTDGRPEAPLKQEGILTLGYGANNEVNHPFRYWLPREYQDIDVGYLKLFFATRPLDLRGIVQDSPFRIDAEEIDTRFSFSSGTREGGRVAPEISDIWFTKVVPIVQTRRNR